MHDHEVCKMGDMLNQKRKIRISLESSSDFSKITMNYGVYIRTRKSTADNRKVKITSFIMKSSANEMSNRINIIVKIKKESIETKIINVN